MLGQQRLVIWGLQAVAMLEEHRAYIISLLLLTARMTPCRPDIADSLDSVRFPVSHIEFFGFQGILGGEGVLLV